MSQYLKMKSGPCLRRSQRKLALLVSGALSVAVLWLTITLAAHAKTCSEVCFHVAFATGLVVIWLSYFLHRLTS